ncbi:unnamed protein product [Arabis nemorensis]|uniref:Arabinogalactan peptide 22 n=1 Tax=Arabis nemorensis TaxID=586526 RepID=A0A565BS53_9BRAS|nr:unnamed protein product [Arabis nemorensis]
MMKIFVQMTLACLVLALLIMMASAQYDYDSTSAKTPNSAVIPATDIFTSFAVAFLALVACFIH